jgi:NAD dependent epimerase/dehydratase family enzyme
VAPEAVTNAEFTAALARAVGRPAIVPVPAFALALLLGQMGREVLLASARVRPARLLESGFHFVRPALDDALRAMPEQP